MSLSLDKYNTLRTVHNVLHSSIQVSIKALFISEIMQNLNIPHDAGLDNAMKIMRAFSNNRRIVELQIRKIEERLFQWIIQNGFTTPPPDHSAFTGSYVIGKVVGNDVDATIDFSLENNLAIIFSKSGGGKTNVMYNVVPQALNKVTKTGTPLHVHIYEMAKREAVYLLSRYPNFLVLNPYTPFNPLFPPPNMDPIDWNGIFWELTCQELGIRYETKVFLEEECAKFFEKKGVAIHNIEDTCPTLPEFIDSLYEKFSNPQTKEERNSRSSIATALKHFRPLCRRFKTAFNVRRGVLQGGGQKVSDHNIIFEMGWPGLTGKDRRLLTKLRVRCTRLEKELNGLAKDIELLTIFEEAKYVWAADRTNKSTIDYMKQEIDEDRALGIAFLGMSQHINDFTDFIKNAAAYYICLPLGKQGIQSAARAMECSEFDIRRLHIPYGIMNIPTHPGGFKIRLEKAPIEQENKEALENQAAEKLLPHLNNTIPAAASAANGSAESQETEVLQRPVEVKIEGKALAELARFLAYIREHPDHSSLSELYDNYRVGREKGTKFKNDLVENGLAEQIKVMDGTRKRPSIRLHVTELGHQWLKEIIKEDA